MEFCFKDVKLYYEIIGSGTPILMVHGWGVDHRLLKGAMEPLFQSTNTIWKRIYFDLPGMGKTNGSSWITGSDPMLEIIINFIDEIIPNQRFVIVANSFGGYLARGLLIKRFNDIDGLLLLSPLYKPFIELDNGEFDKGNVPDRKILEKDESFLRTLAKNDREDFEYINVLLNQRVWIRFKDEILPGLRMADNNFLNNTLGQNVPFSFSMKLDSPFIKPTLMLMGRQDFETGYQNMWKIIEDFPRASYVVLDKAGHNLYIEQDLLFNSLVEEWLNRVIENKLIAKNV